MTGEHEVRIRRLDQPGDLGWVVMAHGEVYAAEFGWDTSFEALVARIVADYAGRRTTRAREAAWIAEVDGQRAGCIFCVARRRGHREAAHPARPPRRPGPRPRRTTWSRPAWSSRGRPGTRACGCGPTTCWSRRAAST